MRSIGGHLFLFLCHAFLIFASFQDIPKSFKSQQSGVHEFVYPIPTDHNGKRLHNSKTYNHYPEEAYFDINLFNKKIKLELKKHRNLLAKDTEFVVHDSKDITFKIDGEKQKNCFYEGKVQSDETSYVTITTCEGLYGIIKTDGNEYFIESVSQHLEKRYINQFDPIPHIIYKTNKPVAEHCSHIKNEVKIARSLLDKPSSNRNRREDEFHNFTMLTIETAVFVDNLMYQFIAEKYPINTDDHLLTHVLTFFGGIEILYNLPSLGQVPVNFVIIKIEVFKTNNLPFNTSDFGNELLFPFCDYQYDINVEDDSNSSHWDHAVLMTGIDIKYDDGRDNLIGMAPIKGFCYKAESCSIVEGTNFDGVYILAHEFGHNLGMDHDGEEENTCDPNKYFMSPYTEPNQREWSNCSKNELAEYLKEEENVCLQDERDPKSEFDFREKLPGQRYSREEQCEIDWGKNSIPDPKQPLEEICHVLDCLFGIFPRQYHSALEGTYCGPGKWCRDKKCEAFNSNDIIAVDGDWSEWSEWSNCSSGCVKGGNGIKVSQRYCDNPRPENGGKPCTGEKYRFQLCSDYYLCKRKQMNTIRLFEKSICTHKPGFIQENVTGEGMQKFKDRSHGCIVWCKTTKYDYYISWDAFYPDGTNCIFGDPSQLSYCYQGKCIDFKCQRKSSKCKASADSLYG